MSRKTKEVFIEEARKIHGDRYDYSKVKYKNNSTPITIICKEHGEYLQRPTQHLRGQGCPTCSYINKRGFKNYTNVVNDFIDVKHPLYNIAYKRWIGIIKRTVDDNIKNLYYSYSDCTICDEWLSFSAFFEWFEANYVDGWDVDKDILVKNNKLYSPQTCCFVPKEINETFIKSKKEGVDCL